jgi:hypothetical protein
VQGSLAKEPPPGWSGQVTGGVDWQTGNAPLVRLSGAAAALWHRRCWLALALVRGEYARARGLELSRRTFEHLRLRRDVGRRVLWEAFVQHEYDAFRRLAVRAVAGSGPAVRLADRGRLRVTTGLAYLLEYERFSALAGAADSGDAHVRHRASSYLTGSLIVGDQLTATQTAHVQPRLTIPATCCSSRSRRCRASSPAGCRSSPASSSPTTRRRRRRSRRCRPRSRSASRRSRSDRGRRASAAVSAW